jgi:molybdenum cofactor guanylyltransferase
MTAMGKETPRRGSRTSGPKRPRFSVIILAGGKSSRMGKDKAFLRLRGRFFISIISEEASKVSDDIIVAIGSKSGRRFTNAIPRSARLVSDSYEVGNPVGGILSGLKYARHSYCAVVACDLPLVKHEVLDYLFQRCRGHSAAVPVWENGDLEPLCAVYKISEATAAGAEALGRGKIGPRHMLSFLDDVQYVKVGELRRFDGELRSLLNVNDGDDYKRLRVTLKDAENPKENSLDA